MKMLVELAQQRNEPIPALLYNSSVLLGMAKDGYERFDGGSYAVSVAEEESDQEGEGRERREESPGEKAREKKEEEVRMVDSEKGEKRGTREEEDEDEEQHRSVKLGLGDFVFYSVLVGRAAMYDIVTVFTCFIGIVAGLFATLVLLTIYRQVP